MDIWTQQEEAEQLKKRFATVKNRAAFAREHNLKGGDSIIYQHTRGLRPISLDAALVYADAFKCSLADISPRLDAEAKQAGLRSNRSELNLREYAEEIDLENNPDYPAIKKVRIRLSAGISGFAVDQIEEDATPIVFRREWYVSRGFKPEKLIALSVSGQSMESGLYEGDTVVVNVADCTPKDGQVFAVNYEGELVIKRVVRDSGEWWLNSDHPDQRRYPPKVCNGDSCIIIGRVIHKQSERI